MNGSRLPLAQCLAQDAETVKRRRIHLIKHAAIVKPLDIRKFRDNCLGCKRNKMLFVTLLGF